MGNESGMATYFPFVIHSGGVLVANQTSKTLYSSGKYV